MAEARPRKEVPNEHIFGFVCFEKCCLRRRAASMRRSAVAAANDIAARPVPARATLFARSRSEMAGEGNVEFHVNIIQRALIPSQIKAGVTVPVMDAGGKPKRDDDGKPLVAAKYPGMHALRHFYASWCINRKQDGGLELPAKVVQHRLGHSSITVTLDTCGHLFPRGDDGAELANATFRKTPSAARVAFAGHPAMACLVLPLSIANVASRSRSR